MEDIREYLVSVTAAALLCGILLSLTGEKSAGGGILRLVCGIFLSFTVIRPVADIQLHDLSLFPDHIMAEAQAAVDEGTDYAKQAMIRHIKSEAEAYILDKARSFGAAINVDVTVSGDDTPVPIRVTVTGQISPYARQQLKRIMESDLGIPEENQQWTASNSRS